MIKRKYIKKAYIEIAVCDKCGAELCPTGICLTSHPAQYSYQCSNSNCDGGATFWEDELPGKLCYEFEEDADV